LVKRLCPAVAFVDVGAEVDERFRRGCCKTLLPPHAPAAATSTPRAQDFVSFVATLFTSDSQDHTWLAGGGPDAMLDLIDQRGRRETFMQIVGESR
jgi:hypothetical protein